MRKEIKEMTSEKGTQARRRKKRELRKFQISIKINLLETEGRRNKDFKIET